MIEKCKLSRQTVISSIRKLEAVNLIRVIRKQGASSLYLLTSPSEWKKPKTQTIKKSTSASNRPVPEIDQSDSDTAPVPNIDHYRSKLDTERISIEVNPLKDNTVADPKSEEKDPETPNGRSPDDDPAMIRQNALENSEYHPEKPSQFPIQRKAYAIAELLQFQHWDNCKVIYAKQAARAYAEGALRDGHDESIIIKAYETALRYCHGVITDEICRRKRHQFEKSNPALTVWLARERLNGDPRTAEQRWQKIIEKLTTEKRKAIEEKVRVHQEVFGQKTEINAWFANSLR